MNPITKIKEGQKLYKEMQTPQWQAKMKSDIDKACEYDREEYITLSAIYMIGYSRGRGL